MTDTPSGRRPAAWRRRLAGGLTLAALALTAAPAQGAPVAAVPEGRVQMVKRTGPEFDRYLDDATPATKEWMNQTVFRSVVYTPYFDGKLAWHDKGWVYRDAYGVSEELVDAHPEWALKDAGGRRLYVNWGCANGTCPLWAADFTHPAFRRHWIAEARETVEKGYRGMWIDDVNSDFRVGNGAGIDVRPIDRRTGRQMTEAAWRAGIADFMQEIRAAFPQIEILHNSIWYSGGPQRDRDPSVRRQIAAADFINLERGVNDAGLTGGTEPFSLHALLGFVDRVHAAGKAVVYEGFSESDTGRDYNLAAYLLTSTGRDGVQFGRMTPDSAWAGFRTDLGRARGPRRAWKGLLRRDFTGGIVLLAPPDNRRTTVALGGTYTDRTGRRVTSVTLQERRGLVLRR